MDGEERDIVRGLGLGAVALACAAATATLVISLGSALMTPSRPAVTPAPLDVSSTLIDSRG